MEVQNKQTIIIDLRQSNNTVPFPRFTQFDTNVLEFNIKENGVNADLTNVTHIVANYKRKDNIVISRTLTANGNLVAYTFGAEEMEVTGIAEVSLSFFNGKTRLSTHKLKLYMNSSLSPYFEGGEGLPLLQELFVEVAAAVQEINDTNVSFNEHEAGRQTQEALRQTAEGQRSTSETERKNAETTRINNEDTRKTQETGRVNAETARVNAESTRASNEQARQEKEAARNTAESGRATAETDRGNAESTRQTNESTRQTNETTRQNQESSRQTNTTSAISRLDSAVNNLKLDYKAPVATFADLATTYPNPQIGWVAQVTNDGTNSGRFFRWNGTAWTIHSEMNNNILTDIQNKLSQSNRQTQTIGQGVSILNASMNAPVNVEVEGRTLTSLGNTPLEASKNYVLTAKRTKIKVGAGTTVHQGVKKFTGESGQPQITRIANFEDKISGSVLENPHSAKFSNGVNVSLLAPSASQFLESSQPRYDNLRALDAVTWPHSPTLGTGNIAQHLFSFDLIAEVERHIGTIPRSDVAGKVQWLKDNLYKFTAYWNGFGASVGGNKATVALWNVSASSWSASIATHSSSVVTRLTSLSMGISSLVDANGFLHFLAYAEPSDGVTSSTINTDYAELEIELKAGADFREPSIPLYEVDAADYAKILVDWNEDEVRRRYPAAKGVQHINGLAILAEGDNLLPPFNEWALHSSASVLAPYELTFTTSENIVFVEALPNTQYTIKATHNGRIRIDNVDATGAVQNIFLGEAGSSRSFTTNATAKKLKLSFYAGAGAAPYTFSQPILTLGSVTKPFVPRNPSMLLAPTKLGAIGTAKDLLFKQDGVWKRRKAVEKDVILDGSLAWVFESDGPGHKKARFPISGVSSRGQKVIKFNGAELPSKAWADFVSGDQSYVDASNLYLSLSDTDTGFGENYTPTANEIKAYFNGWKKTAYAAANPATAPNLAVSGTAGTLPAGTYYVKYTWVTPAGETMASPSTSIAVAAGQQIDVTLPALPPGVTSANIYISATSGAETKQGNTTTGTFTQSAALAAGTTLPASNTAVDQWKSVVDGTTVPTTNTIAFVSANSAPNYTPYKLSYVLATPVVETVNVEGDIVANGPTQIEVTAGAIVREKVTPQPGINGNASYYYINTNKAYNNHPKNELKNRVEKFLDVYKNGNKDNAWSFLIEQPNAFGKQYAFATQANFDATAEYTVTYLAFDRQLLTVNPLDVDASFAQNVRSAVDDITSRLGDLTTISSVNVQAIAELYKRVKALGG